MKIERNIFSLEALTTCSGAVLRDVRIGYEMYGRLNAARDNALLVCHYFAGNAHAAGRYAETDPLPGWWDAAIGPGKMFDTDHYCVICSDSLVNLNVRDGRTASTGPATLNRETGAPYGLTFPLVTITDMVRAQRALLDQLGIERLVAVAGPSAGAMQALEWSVEFPECVPRVVAVVPPGLRMHPYAGAVMDCWARQILTDADWCGGHYSPERPPRKGLVEAFRLMNLTALSFSAVERIAGTGWADPALNPGEALDHEFAADAMLGALAAPRAEVTDANHLLYMTRACKLFDVTKRLARAKAKYLLAPAESDQLFVPALSEAALAQLRAAGLEAELVLVPGQGGHLDGLMRLDSIRDAVWRFLSG
ncbi:MAG: alpha/beta fold hydrolase [Betaproteobacteria bacterium]